MVVVKSILLCCRPSRDPDDDAVIFDEDGNAERTPARVNTRVRISDEVRIDNPMHDVDRSSRQSWAGRISGLARRSARSSRGSSRVGPAELSIPLSAAGHTHDYSGGQDRARTKNGSRSGRIQRVDDVEVQEPKGVLHQSLRQPKTRRERDLQPRGIAGVTAVTGHTERVEVGLRGRNNTAMSGVLSSEKYTKLAQKFGQLQLFIAAFPEECMGQLAPFGPT